MPKLPSSHCLLLLIPLHPFLHFPCQHTRWWGTCQHRPDVCQPDQGYMCVRTSGCMAKRVEETQPH
jgi:hypothetical protein